uniref:Fibronectin type-III domain-containing protein n=1 Tax=Glossina palpalis gambiensis TaxID=67801 RepID=A0A1B0ARZ6_9MUSC
MANIPLNNYYTEYEVKVQALNNVGKGPKSEVVLIYSAENMPLVAPQKPKTHAFNSTAFNVTWEPIELTRENIRGKFIGHRIKYWKTTQEEEDAVYYLSRTTRNWGLIVGLQPETYYFVQVMAYNAAGEGPESERAEERTYRKAPQKPPSSVHIYGINPSTVRVVRRYGSRMCISLSTSHMKQCIMSEQRFDFLRELVKNIPDISVAEEAAQYQDDDNQSSNEEPCNDSDTPYYLSMPSTSTQRHHLNSFNGCGGEGDNGDDAVSPNGFTTQPKQADLEHSSHYQHVKRETPESSSHRLKLRRLLPKSSNSSSYLPTILPTANTNNVNSASVRDLNVLSNLSGTNSESSPLPEPYTTQLKTQRLKH